MAGFLFPVVWLHRGKIRYVKGVNDMEIKQYAKLPVRVLEQYPRLDEEAVHKCFEEEYKDFHRKVVVLDDDPTGVQTVHGVPVYTDWSYESLKEGMEEEGNLFFVLTNSRSFSEQESEREHRLLAARAVQAARDSEKQMLLISRGDSTLRGHYPLEPEALRKELEAGTGRQIHGQILCPFFREGGRYTINSVHYVKEGDELVPAGQTEFARDKTFGFRSSHLGDYVEEKSHGRYTREEGIYITLDLLRAQKYDAITQLLCGAENFQPVLVDAIAQCDVEIFAVCLLRAMKAGREFLIRSAAAVPKVLGNVSSRPLLTKEELTSSDTEAFPEKDPAAAGEGQRREDSGTPGKLWQENDKDSEREYGGIVLIGSHVKKTTLQLQALMETETPAEFLEFDVNTCFKTGGLEAETERIIEKAEKAMGEGKTAVVYTSRTLLAPEGVGKEELLKLSVNISNAVTAVIAGLHRKPRFLIAKGGITSSDVGTKALRVRKALVLGQVQPGIPVWQTGPESKFPGLSYIIFPGNVGETDTLKKIVELLNG